jgi:hypothetical protein
MITDTEIKVEGLRALTTALGEVQAEKFIALLLREPFNYTKWRQKLWVDRTVEDISKSALKLRSAH